MSLFPIVIVTLILIVLTLMVLLIKSKRKHKIKGKNGSQVEMVEKLPMEFSKVILVVTFAIAIVILSFAMIVIYMGATSGYGSDSSNLNTLLVGLFSEISVGTGFYYWKARRENEITLQAKHNTGTEYEEDSNEVI